MSLSFYNKMEEQWTSSKHIIIIMVFFGKINLPVVVNFLSQVILFYHTQKQRKNKNDLGQKIN